MITLDLSGLEALIAGIDEIQAEIPKMNAEYMRQEWYKFLDFVLDGLPYDTGHMANSFKMSEIRQKDNLTEAEWANLADYASFNNYGFRHYISGEKISGVFWWERAFKSLGKESEARYVKMLEELWEAKISSA